VTVEHRYELAHSNADVAPFEHGQQGFPQDATVGFGSVSEAASMICVITNTWSVRESSMLPKPSLVLHQFGVHLVHSSSFKVLYRSCVKTLLMVSVVTTAR